MSTATIERKYCALRIEAGVYIQPSNDGTRRYVIARFEDGRDHGLEDGPQRFTFWSWGGLTEAKHREILSFAQYDVDSAVWGLRNLAAGHGRYATKREAVDAVLRHSVAA